MREAGDAHAATRRQFLNDVASVAAAATAAGATPTRVTADTASPAPSSPPSSSPPLPPLCGATSANYARLLDAYDLPALYRSRLDRDTTYPRHTARALRTLQADDVWYPTWLAGMWRVTSLALATAGDDHASGDALRYRARFLRRRVRGATSAERRDGEAALADRPFNVTAISRAALGEHAVLDCRETRIATGWRRRRRASLALTLAPATADGRLFRATLRVTGRAFASVAARARERSPQRDRDDAFCCVERVRQVIAASDVGGDTRVSPTTLAKDVEITTMYARVSSLLSLSSSSSSWLRDRDHDRRDHDDDRRDRDNDACVLGVQRAATYPARGDAHYADTRGAPIDVRAYILCYTREKRL